MTTADPIRYPATQSDAARPNSDRACRPSPLLELPTNGLAWALVNRCLTRITLLLAVFVLHMGGIGGAWWVRIMWWDRTGTAQGGLGGCGGNPGGFKWPAVTMRYPNSPILVKKSV